MDVITLASRKGGAGKSTLTAQLAAQAHALGKRVLVIDADPQGSLKLWHSRRADEGIKLVTPERGLERALAFAMIEGFRHRVHRHRADHVGGGAGGDPRRDPGPDSRRGRASSISMPCRRPSRPRTSAASPYAVVINAAPVQRDDKEPRWSRSRAPISTAQIPVWAGRSASAPASSRRWRRRERRRDRTEHRGGRGDRRGFGSDRDGASRRSMRGL
jgi:chromosome partitioning protein